MQKLKAVLQAFTGYAGSSENPEKISARFMGIALGVASQVAPVITALFSVDVTHFVNEAQPVVLLVACVMWTCGAIKACWSAAKANPTLGAFLSR